MRRILLILILIMSCFYGYSQETEEIAATQEDLYYSGNSELKVNGLYLLIGFPELSFEYILNKESALGVSVAFSIEEVIDLNFMAVPYYRVYFGLKPAAGFFVEGNAALYSVVDSEYTYYDNDSYDKTHTNEIGGGLGMAVGGKFITKSQWVFEVFGGGGRNFINTDEIGGVYPRFGVSVGKRF